jgi:hypothetical protein
VTYGLRTFCVKRSLLPRVDDVLVECEGMSCNGFGARIGAGDWMMSWMRKVFGESGDRGLGFSGRDA